MFAKSAEIMYYLRTMITINTEARAPKETKRDGFIPAVYYGAHAKSTPIFINEIEFKKAFHEAGESTVITLKTEHGNEQALIHDVWTDPVKDNPRHVDFYIVEKGQKIEVHVPITFIGDSQAVKEGGVLVKVLHELYVQGDSASTPHEISVDISSLVTKDSVICAKDLVLPKGVTLYHVNEDDIVASIAEAKEELEEPVTAVDLSAIEVEKKGKKEEEGATTEAE